MKNLHRDDLPVEFYRQQAAQMQEVATATRHIRYSLSLLHDSSVGARDNDGQDFHL